VNVNNGRRRKEHKEVIKTVIQDKRVLQKVSFEQNKGHQICDPGDKGVLQEASFEQKKVKISCGGAHTDVNPPLTIVTIAQDAILFYFCVAWR